VIRNTAGKIALPEGCQFLATDCEPLILVDATHTPTERDAILKVKDERSRD
jgi:hypothetical protein